ncbi:serine/threonine-protein kinase [Stieleria varia]|uniref:Serine/threonine-protein kinase PknA n=1 Tax=Stieleria varia TaxID=2528005 RepID=A0A5C6AYJ3_9BACT|nr:serine/threonine-protein kinase [Stieleria varia]TWU04557.1 Serine/threonine-protein kinase PknA [Stieleria varia]
MPRSRLGPLAIESKLGDHPSTSSVWRAIHVQLKRAVAVKVFSAPFGGTPEARAQFTSEWEQLKKVQHPALARCYGGGFEDRDAYLAYELVEGETLRTQLDRLTRLSWESVLDMAEPIVDALEYLHGQGIIHGAIVPDKIVFSGLSPVLLDVRVHRFDSPFRSARPPAPSEIALTAPELVANPLTGSVSTDLYSLGAVLYLAVTGRYPIDGDTIEQVRQNLEHQVPASPASIVLDCPIWLDRLIIQMLEKSPPLRPPSASAVRLALAEVRRRAMSRSGVAEHVSSGFSPLRMTNQSEKDEARKLLGRELIDVDATEKKSRTSSVDWHEQPWLLILGLALVLGVLVYIAWPPSEAGLRSQAEALIAQDTRSALADAKNKPLRLLLQRFPDGENAAWAQEQIDRIDVILFLHQLKVKIKNRLSITDQGEQLHMQAQEYAANEDYAKALDKYHSMVTVLGDDDEYRVAVNAARFQIGVIERLAAEQTDAAEIIQGKLDEAERLLAENRVIEARKIWYSLVELYGDNSNLAPLIKKAQDKLREQDSN